MLQTPQAMTPSGQKQRYVPVVALAVLAVAGGTAGCGRPTAVEERAREAAYLSDPGTRRQVLLGVLVNPDNAYAKLRRAHYSTGAGGDWDRLRAWNPRTRLVTAHDLAPAEPRPAGADFAALAIGDETQLLSGPALHVLGEQAFFRYPAQLAPAASESLGAATVGRYGFWVDAVRGVGGLVRAKMADGSSRLAFTCATCHADVVDGRLVAGLPSARLDVGRMIADTNATRGMPAEGLANFLAWGPGRVDVTTVDGLVPERIADLRPVRWLTHLQYDATVRQTDLVSLAMRIETLIITAHAQSIRPPRIVSLALAQFVRDLASELPAAPPPGTSGSFTFEDRCTGCHGGAGLTGAPQPIEVVGTDSTLGESAERGTGSYRVPSLRGVGLRPTLMHDGSVRSLAALFDPGRLVPGYRGGARGSGAVRGHEFGLDLSPEERRALVSYLQRL